jgi:hypothetical protein
MQHRQRMWLHKGKGKTKQDQTGPDLEEVAAPTDTTGSVRSRNATN